MVLDYIDGRHKALKGTTVFGWSNGSLVAMLTAQKYPEKVKNLVLYGFPIDTEMTFKDSPIGQMPHNKPTTANAAAEDFIVPGTISKEAIDAYVKAALDAAGAKYISADAQSSSGKQLSDIESLIAQGATALIILAQDASAVGPAVQAASDEGIPVVAYDRLIEDERAFYLTFDNVEVGRMQARAVLAAQPTGNYVMIKGSPTDPNADFLRGGQQEILQAAIDAGEITIVDEAYTDGWLPANAQRNMEQILTANDNMVDAVVASNDGTAGGAVASLTAHGMECIAVSGQDGDHAVLIRVALGTQTVSVWKDARELGRNAAEIAVALASDEATMIDGSADWTSPSGTTLSAMFLAPVPITADNLTVVTDAGWINVESLCQGVTDGPAPCS